MLLPTGGVTNQSIPIVLPVDSEDKARLDELKAIALSYEGRKVAIIRDPEFYQNRKEERCSRTWGMSNPNHPHIQVSHSGQVNSVVPN